MRSWWVPALLVLVLGVAGCGASSPSATARLDSTTQTTVPGTRLATKKPLATKVLVVIEENHSLAQMRSGMPYLAGLSNKYGYATRWQALTHPSEPNYLAIVGGSLFGVTNDKPPAVNAAKVGSAPSVFSQARRAGKTAGTYADSMPSKCALKDSGPYAVRHNPWTYFAADRAACKKHDVSTAGFAAAAKANKLPNVGFLIPDKVHDAHDASLGDADAWLKRLLAPVLASSDFTSGRLVVIVTADEDDKHSGNVVLTSVLTPRISHKVVTTKLTHYSLTRFIAQVLRVAPLKNGATAPDMRAAFGL